MDNHAIIKTSPKGEAFSGVCIQCGRGSLPMTAAQEPCDMKRELTDAEELLDIVKPE